MTAKPNQTKQNGCYYKGGHLAAPPPLQPLQACFSRVMTDKPNQTKQNGR